MLLLLLLLLRIKHLRLKITMLQFKLLLQSLLSLLLQAVHLVSLIAHHSLVELSTRHSQPKYQQLLMFLDCLD